MSASSGETITVGPLPLARSNDVAHEVHRGLAPPRALHDQGPAPLGDQRLDRPPLILAQPGRARGIPDEPGEDGIRLRPEIRVARVLHASHTTGRDRQTADPLPWAVDNPDGVVVSLIRLVHRLNRNHAIREIVCA